MAEIWKNLGTPGKGAAIGLAAMLPFVPGMLGSRKKGGELRDIYSSVDPVHNLSADRSDSLLVCMRGNVEQINTAVHFRLSPAQIAILAPGIELITRSFQTHQRTGTSPLSYPFRNYPPPRGFNRGSFNQMFMDSIIDPPDRLCSGSKTTGPLNEAQCLY
jgi:hypothetical protein